jgi:hypothetical protein
MSLAHQMSTDQIVEWIGLRFRALADRGREPELVELSESYAAGLDSRFLRAGILTIPIDASGSPAFSGVPARLVASEGIINVVA